jgi:hypothetical protein
MLISLDENKVRMRIRSMSITATYMNGKHNERDAWALADSKQAEQGDGE